MFFRFGAAAVLVVVVALLSAAIEKQNLSLKRAISLQEYRLQQLQENRVRARLRLEQRRSPVRLIERVPGTVTAESAETGNLPMRDEPEPFDRHRQDVARETRVR